MYVGRFGVGTGSVLNSIGTLDTYYCSGCGLQGFFPVWVNWVWRAESQSSHIHRGEVKQLAPIAIPNIEWGGKPSDMWSFKQWIERG